jgi:hypothetical protein
MSEQYNPVVPQQEAKTPSAPLPLDPSLLRHVGGGSSPPGGDLWSVGQSQPLATGPIGGYTW